MLYLRIVSTLVVVVLIGLCCNNAVLWTSLGRQSYTWECPSSDKHNLNLGLGYVVEINTWIPLPAAEFDLLVPYLHTVVVSGPCLTDFLQVAGLPSRIPSLVPHLHTMVVSGPCLTMTQPKTVGCLARAWGSTTGTSCMWPTPVTMSGGRPRESHLRERRRAWELSQVNEGKLSCCSWNCLHIEMLRSKLRGV